MLPVDLRERLSNLAKIEPIRHRSQGGDYDRSLRLEAADATGFGSHTT
ncbi:hypothetical protein ABZ942_31310 [Nocardia sp. NPDC046473]